MTNLNTTHKRKVRSRLYHIVENAATVITKFMQTRLYVHVRGVQNESCIVCDNEKSVFMWKIRFGRKLFGIKPSGAC